MPFDALTVAAVRQELRRTVLGGRVQNLLLPGPLSLSLEIYKAGVGRTHLLMSAHPQQARVHLVNSAPSRDPEQHPPLLLLLRKYVRGGTILDVRQPPQERVLALSIAKRIGPDKRQEYHSEGDFRHTQASEEEGEEAEDAPLVVVELIVELMGRLSNIILVGEDGIVLDSIKRIPPSLNRYRTTLPHQPYIPPPPQEKRDAMRATINTLSLELARAAESEANTAVWKGLVGGFAGVSPTLAREAVYRSLRDVSLKAADIARQPPALTALLAGLQSLLGLEAKEEWEPTVAWREGKSGERAATDFAPYPLTHLAQGGELTHYGGISEAASRYFASSGTLGGHSALKTQVRETVEEWRKREASKLYGLREEWTRAQALEELRHRGEYLLAFMHEIKPGQRQLKVPGESLTIDLDPALSPSEQAQAIFREYRKAKAAQEGLPERIAEVEMRLAYADEMLTSLDLAANYDDIRAVQAEVAMARTPTVQAAPSEGKEKGRGQRGAKRGGKPQVKLPQPLRLRTRTGAHILLGRTATQNDTATFRLAAPDDIWLHARGAPGAHVILRSESGFTPEDLQEAASIAAGYSKLRAEAQVDVIYTEKRHVRKVANAPPGFVTFRNERVLRVAPKRAMGKE